MGEIFLVGRIYLHKGNGESLICKASISSSTKTVVFSSSYSPIGPIPIVHYYLGVLDNYPLLSVRPMDMLVASNVTIYKVVSALDLSYILSPRNLLKLLSLLSYLLHRLLT